MRFLTLIVILFGTVWLMELPAQDQDLPPPEELEQTPEDQPSTEEDWISGAREKVQELQAEHDAALAQADQALATNALTQKELGNLEDQVKDIAKERDQWVKYGNAQHEKVLKDQAAILRRDLIIVFLVLAIAVYAFLKFYLRIPFL